MKTPQSSRRGLLVGAGGATVGLAADSISAAHAAGARTRRASTDVVVVGAGLAGLTAARDLVARGHDVVVLEARDRVGGRILNHHLDAEHVVEVGGQWLGPADDAAPADPTQGAVRGQARVAALAESLGVRRFPTYGGGSLVDYRSDLPNQRATYTGRIPTHDPAAAAELGAALIELDRLCATVPVEAPWTADRALAWDSMTVQTWMDHGDTASGYPYGGTAGAYPGLRTPGGRKLFELAIEAVFSAEPRDVSFLHALFYLHSAGSMESLINTAGGAQQDRVVGGSQIIALRLAQRLGQQGVRIHLSSPVRTIEQTKSHVRVSTDGVQIDARRVVVAIPPTLAARIDYRPGLPALRDQLTQRIPMGTVIKVQCIYDEPFWRDEGLAGQATSDTGPVKVTFDNSPPDAAPAFGVLMGFIEGSDGRAWVARSESARRKAVADSMARYFGPQALKVRDYIEKSWASDPWSRGCYGGYFPTGVWSDYGHVLRAPVGRIHWAGTETSPEWMGYMDGAVRSGERVAREVSRAPR